MCDSFRVMGGLSGLSSSLLPYPDEKEIEEICEKSGTQQEEITFNKTGHKILYFNTLNLVGNLINVYPKANFQQKSSPLTACFCPNGEEKLF